MKNLSQGNKILVLLAALAGVVLISLISYYTGDFSLEVAYALAILLPSWYAGRLQGVAATAAAGAGILLSNHYYHAENTTVRNVNMVLEVVVLLIISLLASALRERHLQAEFMASFDSLTGVSNRNSFFILADHVLREARRYRRPFSLAFIDLDNFKQVNDLKGHLEGDKALRTVAEIIKSSLRQTDVVARFGGDEFVVLLPETDHFMAESALTKLQARLLGAMQANNWPITFSIGAVACSSFQFSINELLQLADRYLYSVKSLNKNDIRIERV